MLMKGKFLSYILIKISVFILIKEVVMKNRFKMDKLFVKLILKYKEEGFSSHDAYKETKRKMKVMSLKEINNFIEEE